MDITILPSIERNQPLNRRDSSKYPPNEYPIKLSILFSKTANNFEFDRKLQSVLKVIPKSKLKYRQTSKYARNYECYVKDIPTLKPIFRKVLSLTNMWERFVLQPDKRIYMDDLYQSAENILADLYRN